MKRILWLSLFLILLPTVSAFSQDKPDPTAQAKPDATDQKPAGLSEEEQAAALAEGDAESGRQPD